jgi:hypothetical protein
MALELPKLGKKEKGGKVASPKNDIMLKVMDFFDKNPIMKIIIPVIIFVIIAAILIFIVFGDGIIKNGGKTDDSDLTNDSNYVQALPSDDIIKDKEIVDLINNDPLSPDILASAKYKGRVKGSNGRVNALIEIGSSGQSIQVERGETIGDSSWELLEVTTDYVIFEADGEQKKINRQ